MVGGGEEGTNMHVHTRVGMHIHRYQLVGPTCLSAILDRNRPNHALKWAV